MPRAAPSPKLPGRAQAKKALQVKELWETVAAPAKAPVLVVNGELDRIRTNYYPPFWARKEMTQLREFVPKIDAAAVPLARCCPASLPRLKWAARAAPRSALAVGGLQSIYAKLCGRGIGQRRTQRLGGSAFLGLDT